MAQTKEQKETLKRAFKEAPSEEQLRDMARRVPPLQRDEEHSFVPVEDTDREDDPDLIQPNLTDTTLAEAERAFVEEEAGKDITIKRDHLLPNREKGLNDLTVNSASLTETDIERMDDDTLKSVLGKTTPRFHPGRIAPSSERTRQPGEKAPAAGAGSWPVHEGQMPAVMPTDPPLEDADDRDLGENGFARRAGFSRAKDGTLKRKGLVLEKDEVAQAAALYLRLRQQFPAFTADQLSDEFEIQWLSGRAGAEQSHRAGDELSGHGLTAVGDDRTTEINLGELRASSDRAFEADPEKPTGGPAPSAGLPSENEPASTAADAAKKPSGETAEADEQALKEDEKAKDNPTT